MKLSLAVGAALVANAYSASLMDSNGGNQAAFQLPDFKSGQADSSEPIKGVVEDSPKDDASNLLSWAMLEEMAAAAGEEIRKIPAEAYSAWADAMTVAPQAVYSMYKDVLKDVTNLIGGLPKYRPSPARLVDWLYVVESDKHPEHTLKVKNPEKLGVDTVKQYSGYLKQKSADKNFFYWFFESRNDPKNDPLVLWLNGGPGCSSLTGLFFELGPASINKEGHPVRNPHSWNNNASVIFLDQPVNTGYSYSSGSVSDTVTAGEDVYAFLELFFKQFPEYKELDFHIAGESYAGHYIPQFAKEILSHEDRSFDLKSVLIGNGLTDPLRQYDLYEPMACGAGGADPVLGEEECANMRSSQDRCNSLIKSCYNTESSWVCVPATIYCNNAMLGPYQRTGRNVYDVREDCEGGSLCYLGLEDVDNYLNKPEVMEAVGAEVETYQGCNFDTNRNFVFAGDWMKPYYTAVTELLAADVPVLIYAGDKDFICNWLGNEAWTRQLEWAKSDKFAQTPFSNWTTAAGTDAGEVVNVEHFTFLRVYGAGHMVPYNQPENSLDMLNRWLAGDRAFN
uniref:Carboxypeptidase n=1 Tax=Blastobotrys adeninivorans TaxID=409370 RepID=A0A060TBY4_BLAAD